MSQPIPPVSQAKDPASRPRQSDAGATTARASLCLVPHLPGDYKPLHRGMWNDDPIEDPTCYTELADWPSDRLFVLMINQALEAGSTTLATQLQEDREFCARARARLMRRQTRAGR